MICTECGYDSIYISEGCDGCNKSDRYMISVGDSLYGPETDIKIDLLWTDPPYGTGKVRRGPKGQYLDPDDNLYVCKVIEQWLPHMSDDGTVAVCCDYRLVRNLLNTMHDAGWFYRGEIVWEFGLGRPRDSWWPVRHNNILIFTKTSTSGKFNNEAVPRQKRLSPGKGYDDPTKRAGSVWNFIMSNTDPQRVGYPTQKPTELVEPFVLAHTDEGDLVADPFCGSGTTGLVAARNGRRFYMADASDDAVETAIVRLLDEGFSQ